MKDIFFSILVPVYNSEEYLSECIESVCNQSYDKWELILVDDGSTDSSKKICQEYMKLNNKIFAYFKSNTGQMDTRRVAFSNAKGDYCIFLDSDDMLEKRTLTTLNDYIKKYNCDCIIYGLKRISKNGNIIDVWQDSEIIKIEEHKDIYKKTLIDSRYNSLCRKAVKRDILDNIDIKNNMEIRNAEDLLESLNIFNISSDVLFIPDILYIYRFNENSITHSIDYERLLNDTITVNQIIIDFLKEKKYFGENDFYKLSILYTDRLIDIIRGISIEYDNDKKIALYEKLNRSDFYKYFILKYKHGFRDLGKKYIIFYLYEKKHYNCISNIEKIYKSIKK